MTKIDLKPLNLTMLDNIRADSYEMRKSLHEELKFSANNEDLGELGSKFSRVKSIEQELLKLNDLIDKFNKNLNDIHNYIKTGEAGK
jgi:Mg2+ and Co2+ transporter CorA